MTNTEQTSVLITRGNEGLGLEAARRLGELVLHPEAAHAPQSWTVNSLTICQGTRLGRLPIR